MFRLSSGNRPCRKKKKESGVSRRGVIYGIFALIAVGYFLIVFFMPRLDAQLVQRVQELDGEGLDAIAIAVQLGRLDVVSLSVAFLGLGVGFFAIFSFFQIREDAQQTARRELRKYIGENRKRFAEELKNEILVELKLSAQPPAMVTSPNAVQVTETEDESEDANERG